jgi:hypothetical protein
MGDAVSLERDGLDVDVGEVGQRRPPREAAI